MIPRCIDVLRKKGINTIMPGLVSLSYFRFLTLIHHSAMDQNISFYIINLKKRRDRKEHILHEFEGFKEIISKGISKNLFLYILLTQRPQRERKARKAKVVVRDIRK